MLSDLSIENLALFDRASIELGGGLNAITGETGAGKSLVVGAVELLLGERPRTGLVRTGAEEARVQGRFLLTRELAAAPELAACLAEFAPDVLEGWAALDPAAERELILARAVGASGRTRAWIDHRPVSLRALKEVAGHLVEIHGQNDHQRLFDPAEQTRVLDAYGATTDLAERWRAARRAFEAARADLDAFDQRARERAERLDLLRFQSQELQAARMTTEEHAEILAERDRLRWAGDLARDLGGLAQSLGDEGGALDTLRRAGRALESWTERIAELRGVETAMSEALAHAEESAQGLERFLATLEGDHGRLEEIEERLYRLDLLRKKHRTDVAGLIERAAGIAREIAQLESADETIEALQKRCDTLRAGAAALAAELAKKRGSAAARLSKQVQEHLAHLGLAQAEFSCAAADGKKPRIDPGAIDPPAVEFFLAANPGEPARPLRHVASGGEAARILLAVRVALALRQAIPTLIFDEIDAGVGGRLGPAVGEHLRQLGTGHQVLVVTHLPAIAALADQHFRVSKLVRGGRTHTSVARLAGDARVAEVADMIAGGAAHATARAEAQRLLGG